MAEGSLSAKVEFLYAWECPSDSPDGCFLLFLNSFSNDE